MTQSAYFKKRNLAFLILFIVLLAGGLIFININIRQQGNQQKTEESWQESTGGIISGSFDKKRFKSDAQWRKLLTAEQFHILREAGTEIPFTGALNEEKRKGTYYSAGCEDPLFRSEQKYDSGTGWPSFRAPISDESLVLRRESAPGDGRIEVLDRCGGHLGHVFDDGPAPTGMRYCMNSAALLFVPDKN